MNHRLAAYSCDLVARRQPMQLPRVLWLGCAQTANAAATCAVTGLRADSRCSCHVCCDWVARRQLMQLPRVLWLACAQTADAAATCAVTGLNNVSLLCNICITLHPIYSLKVLTKYFWTDFILVLSSIVVHFPSYCKYEWTKLYETLFCIHFIFLFYGSFFNLKCE